METEIYKNIKGYNKITDIFGYWPSFHDAEVLSVQIERDKDNGPTVSAKIHVFEMKAKGILKSKFDFIKHSIVSILFGEVRQIDLNCFDNQNPIFDLDISDNANEEMAQFKVVFNGASEFGFSFICNNIEVISVERKIPDYSIYNNDKL